MTLLPLMALRLFEADSGFPMQFSTCSTLVLAIFVSTNKALEQSASRRSTATGHTLVTPSFGACPRLGSYLTQIQRYVNEKRHFEV